MKKALRTLIIFCLIATVAACCIACTDKIYSSTWEMAVAVDGNGDVVACGKGYSYGEDVLRVTVTCNISKDGEITIKSADNQMSMKGQMTELSTGADGEVRYSIAFEDGRTGTAVYKDKKDDSYPSDVDKDDLADKAELYELSVSVSDVMTLYFVRGAEIK